MTRPRHLRFSRLARGSVGLALSTVVFMGASDLHGSALNHSTFKTPTPVLWTDKPHSADDHMEPGAGALAPAHEPVLFKTAKPFIKWLEPAGALAPPGDSEWHISHRQSDLAPQYLRLPSPARAPPVA